LKISFEQTGGYAPGADDILAQNSHNDSQTARINHNQSPPFPRLTV
jgi:hypothetical protein